MRRKNSVVFTGLELKCPKCGGSNFEVTRAGTRILCRKCFAEFRPLEVPKT